MKSKILGLLAVGTILVGCAESETETHSDSDRAVEASTCSAADMGATGATGATTKGLSWNGLSLNGPVFQGVRLNGFKFNGTEMNGPILQGVALNGMKINGIQFNGPTLNGVELNGPLLQGTKLGGVPGAGAGVQLEGAELEGHLTDGSTIPIFIEHVLASPDAKNADVTLYQVSYGTAHEPLCGVDDKGAPKLATALANVWDERTGTRIESNDEFTFACQGAALYKCVAAGYKPWKGATDAELHQACTRMIRADYCGDGTSFTKDGTLIDMGDDHGIQSFETLSRPDFAFEASWGPNGATCVSKTRYPLTSLPQCLRERMADSCDGSIGLTNRSATNNVCLR